MSEENRIKEMLDKLSPEERKAKLDYWCPDLTGQLIITDADGTVLVDPKRGINLLADEEEKYKNKKKVVDDEEKILNKKKE